MIRRLSFLMAFFATISGTVIADSTLNSSPADTATYYKAVLNTKSNTAYFIGETSDGFPIIASYDIAGGSLNTTFNETGFVTKTTSGTDAAIYYDITIDPQNNIIVVGSTYDGFALLACYTPQGKLNPLFNDTGFVATDNFRKAYYAVYCDSTFITVISHIDLNEYFAYSFADGLIHHVGLVDDTFFSSVISNYGEGRKNRAINIIPSGRTMFIHCLYDNKIISFKDWYDTIQMHKLSPPASWYLDPSSADELIQETLS